MILGRKHHILAATVFMLSVSALPAGAEELILKDGQKIVGTIVGYENGMFRVETEYGFALVRKDKVVSVNFVPASEKPAPQQRADLKNANAKPKPATSSQDQESGRGHVERVVIPIVSSLINAKPEPPPAPARLRLPAKVRVSALPAALPPAPPPVSRPLDEPLPAHIQEHVVGTSYVNDTFRFAMFKPPGWKTYEEVPKETGAAIMAIGSEDEQTLLFVDRQVWSGAPDLKSDRAEAPLRKTYQEYQKLSESTAELDGHPAIRRVFRGVIDGVEWHGLSIHVANGNTVFGIIGLTSAETFQFQQALFSKIINSFHFLTPAAPVGAPSRSAPALYREATTTYGPDSIGGLDKRD